MFGYGQRNTRKTRTWYGIYVLEPNTATWPRPHIVVDKTSYRRTRKHAVKCRATDVHTAVALEACLIHGRASSGTQSVVEAGDKMEPSLDARVAFANLCVVFRVPHSPKTCETWLSTKRNPEREQWPKILPPASKSSGVRQGLPESRVARRQSRNRVARSHRVAPAQDKTKSIYVRVAVHQKRQERSAKACQIGEDQDGWS